MMYKATISFTGVISMAMGEVRDISDQSLADDLIRAGHIIPYVADEKPKTSTKRRTKANEN